MPKIASAIVLLENGGAKSYMTRKELSAYETLTNLIYTCDDDVSTWGLCQKEDQLRFGSAGNGWVLQCSLQSLVTRANALYHEDGVPAYDPDDVYIVYGIEYNPRNPTLYNCGCDVYHLPKEEEQFHPGLDLRTLH